MALPESGWWASAWNARTSPMDSKPIMTRSKTCRSHQITSLLTVLPKAQVETEERDTVGTERDLPFSRTHLFTSQIRGFAEGHTVTLRANIVAREILIGSLLYGRQRGSRRAGHLAVQQANLQTAVLGRIPRS